MQLDRTFFVTTTYKRYTYFRDFTKARRFFQALCHYRRENQFLIHAFVLMPDHLHMIVTPSFSMPLEKTMQLVKGGSSFRMRLPEKLWQHSFTGHRIRDLDDCEIHVGYILRNPVKEKLAESAEKYPLCSAWPGWKLDPIATAVKATFEAT